MTGGPNIVFFFTDQQRADTCGCYGQPLEVTPNLDRLADQGVRFEAAFTCQPVCGPARSCVQTGRYATETGCFRNDIALPRDARSIAHLFGDAGYETAYVGKWHLASGGPEEKYRERAVPLELRGGWKDYWLAADVLEHTSTSEGGYMFDRDMNRVEFGGYRVDSITDFALEYLREKRDPGKPFFLFISYLEPHHQNNRNRYEGPEGSKERFKDYAPPKDLEGTEGNWRENYPDYLGCCWSLDRNLARLLDELDRQGIRENTLIVYTSDHGSHFRTRNGEYKRSCHDASIRIPMVASGPGFEGGKTVEGLASLIDIPPTLLRAAGIDIPKAMRGRPLQDLASGEAEDWPDEVFVQISESQVGRAVRTNRWKYSVSDPAKDGWKDGASDRYYEEFLYDLETDPSEKRNLVADESLEAVRNDLADRLKRRMVEAGEAEPVILPFGRRPSA